MNCRPDPDQIREGGGGGGAAWPKRHMECWGQ